MDRIPRHIPLSMSDLWRTLDGYNARDQTAFPRRPEAHAQIQPLARLDELVDMSSKSSMRDDVSI
jgi:hypothetical protein